MGNILDSGKKQQIEDIAESILKDFTLAYTTAYGVEYTKKTLEDIDEESFGEQPPTYQLMHRSNDKSDLKLKTGFLTKKGAVVKNWKRRYFVVFPDYSVEYYENDEAFNKGFKAKGTIVPSGYEVVADIDKALMERAVDLAKQLGVSEKDVPKPEKLPEHTFQLYHARRRSFFISADSAEVKDAWVEMFKSCCYRSRGLRSEDPVVRAAFEKAVRKVYWSSTSSSGGTEEQILSDIIVNQINYKVMSDAYHTIPGPYAMKQKVREQVVKSLDSLVMAMVIPSWKGMVETTEQAKTTLEPTIKDKKEEMAAVQRKVMWDLAEALQSTMEKALADVKGMMKEMADILRPQIVKALKSTRERFVKTVDEITEKAMSNNDIEEALKSYFYTLDKVPRSSFGYYLMSSLYSKLHDQFDKEIPTLHEYGVIYLGEDLLKEILDSAMFTFEELFTDEIKDTDAKTNGRTAADKMQSVKEDVLVKFDADTEVVGDEFVLKGMMYVWVAHIHKQIDSVCKPVIKPLERSIPEPLRQVISLDDKYDTYVENTVKDTIRKVCGLEGDQSNSKSDKTAKVEEKPADEKPSEGEQKPSEGEQKPNEGEQKPSADEQKPTEDEQKPSADEQKPTEDEQKPTEGEQKPTEDEQKPTEGEQKPTEGEQKPTEGEQKPSADEQKPTEGEQKPTEGEQKPTEGEQKPSADEQKPTEDEQKPTEGEQKPTEGEQKPSADEQKPTEDEQKPTEGEQKPTEGEQKPSEGEQKPSEDEKKPSEGEQKPNEGQAKESEKPQETTSEAEASKAGETSSTSEEKESEDPTKETDEGMTTEL